MCPIEIYDQPAALKRQICTMECTKYAPHFFLQRMAWEQSGNALTRNVRLSMRGSRRRSRPALRELGLRRWRGNAARRAHRNQGLASRHRTSLIQNASRAKCGSTACTRMSYTKAVIALIHADGSETSYHSESGSYIREALGVDTY